ncbi:MAG: GxxExxY protein [Chloroflexota bacterium]|nr:GxxExxY protein [Chloroflexota bacterium]MDE2910938.1 GxxExxY protein [Chloroflexota bacterium]
MSGSEKDPLTGRIIGAAMNVHSAFGAGLLESVYQNALCIELEAHGIRYQAQQAIDIKYRGQHVGRLIADIVVEDRVILELKSVDSLLPIHTAQLITYLKATGIKTGLLINFNVRHLRHGIKRVVY